MSESATPTPPRSQSPDRGDAQVSQAGSGALNSETAQGGADAVPDTPDGVSENYTPQSQESAEESVESSLEGGE